MNTLAFLPGGMPGMGEMIAILLIVTLLFGARKLPQLARALGASLNEFKKGQHEGASEKGESEPLVKAAGRERRQKQDEHGTE